jgi:hypothetical protein
MKRALCIVVATVAIGCGGEKNVPDSTQSGESSQSMARSVPGGQTPPADPPAHTTPTGERTTSAGNAAISDQVISLTGCLTGGEAPNGSAPSSNGATRSAAGDSGSSGSNRFLLTRATVDPGSAGVGASGAGASGGPLVSGASDYLLQGGDMAELRGHLGHQVRVSARLNTQQIAQPQGTPTGSAETAGNPMSADRGTAGSGAAQMPRAIPNGPPNGAVIGGGANVQSLIVESIQMVAAACPQR